ncbi:MAG: sugar O-acetyltransferase [Oscillospiraceae bacterium]|nr:sugar O-acetyltransferase [Oscillospiraceae bacterium]
MEKSWRDKINSGEIYYCSEAGFFREQIKCLMLLDKFNRTRPNQQRKRTKLAKRFFGAAGKNLYIEPPLHANWGRNTYWGDNCYANFNLTLVDDGEIHIGDGCLLAPNVVLATAGHPLEPELRRKAAQFSKPIRIGKDVWIGANAVVLPGVSIGDGSVIGAGSVVTKDIPARVVAVGNPCRMVRKIEGCS